MGKNDRSTTAVSLRCCKCGSPMIIWRLAGRLRDKNHIKTLYCVRCNKRTPHKQDDE